MSKSGSDNRANQLNPNNPAYWSGRGMPAPTTPPTAPASPAPTPVAPTEAPSTTPSK